MAREQERKVELLGVEPRASGLPYQCSATELHIYISHQQQPFNPALCSFTLAYDWLLIVSESCVLLLMREIIEQITVGIPMVRTPIIL